MKRPHPFPLLCVFALFLGCAIPLLAAPQRATISILEKELEDRTPARRHGERPNFKTLVSELELALFEAGFRVLNENDLGKAFEFSDKQGVFDGIDEGAGKATGKVICPAYKLRCTINRYGYETRVATDPRNPQLRSTALFANVDIIFILLDARSGEKVAMVQGNGGGRVVLPRGVQTAGNFGEQVLQHAIRQCAGTLIARLQKIVPARFLPPPLSGKVRAVSKGGGYVKLDEVDAPVQVGALLEVFEVQKLAADDEDEDDPLVEETRIGTIRVVQKLRNGNLKCEAVDSVKPIQTGNSVRKAAVKAPMPAPPPPTPTTAPGTPW